MAEIHYPPVGPCRVQSVLLVDLYERLQPDYRFVANSLPGHLIQLMIEGQTEHEANGRRYVLRPRSLIWYHEDELVRGLVLQSPWRFYTLNFIAPALPPPPFEQRVRSVDARMMKRSRTCCHYGAMSNNLPPCARCACSRSCSTSSLTFTRPAASRS